MAIALWGTVKTLFAPFDIFRVRRNARPVWVEHALNLKTAMTHVYTLKAGTYHIISKARGPQVFNQGGREVKENS